jgi:hypothetical protein
MGLSGGSRSRIGIGGALLLVLVVLGGGLCLFDHSPDGTHHHGMPQDLCWIMLVIPTAALTLARLVPREWVGPVAGVEPVVVPLSVLDPPPRRLPLV